MKLKYYISFFFIAFAISLFAEAPHYIDAGQQSTSSFESSTADDLIENSGTSHHSKLELSLTNFRVISNSFRSFEIDFGSKDQFALNFLIDTCFSNNPFCFDKRVNISQLPLFKLFSNYRL